jgi:hypothetical protein
MGFVFSEIEEFDGALFVAVVDPVGSDVEVCGLGYMYRLL